ncbi:MAG: hypothetical protein QW279_10645 [Candidatus Jordarchaeaceae archaeon]
MNVKAEIAEKALASASTLNISSWDGYLIEIAKELGFNKIYAIDQRTKKENKGYRNRKSYFPKNYGRIPPIRTKISWQEFSKNLQHRLEPYATCLVSYLSVAS